MRAEGTLDDADPYFCPALLTFLLTCRYDAASAGQAINAEFLVSIAIERTSCEVYHQQDATADPTLPVELLDIIILNIVKACKASGEFMSIFQMTQASRALRAIVARRAASIRLVCYKKVQDEFVKPSLPPNLVGDAALAKYTQALLEVGCLDFTHRRERLIQLQLATAKDRERNLVLEPASQGQTLHCVVSGQLKALYRGFDRICSTREISGAGEVNIAQGESITLDHAARALEDALKDARENPCFSTLPEPRCELFAYGSIGSRIITGAFEHSAKGMCLTVLFRIGDSIPSKNPDVGGDPSPSNFIGIYSEKRTWDSKYKTS